MAGLKFRRNLVLCFNLYKTVYIFSLNFETIPGQVFSPIATAPSGR
ncbi:MAG: hypothetical protein WBB69_08540 [Anaerolineales bacterium]